MFSRGGINLNQKQIDTSRKKGNKFLFVGRDFYRKNGPLVVQAFKQLHSHYQDIELYIAGPDKREHDSVNGIYYLGMLTHDVLVKYFNLCDYFVMPSKFEAYGLVFPEALTFGLPCIGRNAFEMPYFIENGITGLLLENENADELKVLMETLLHRSDIKQNVINNQNKYISEYSWDSVVERMVRHMKIEENKGSVLIHVYRQTD